MLEWSVGGGRYSPDAHSALTQIVPYSSSLHTVFHSVIYNSMVYSKTGFANSQLVRLQVWTELETSENCDDISSVVDRTTEKVYMYREAKGGEFH